MHLDLGILKNGNRIEIPKSISIIWNQFKITEMDLVQIPTEFKPQINGIKITFITFYEMACDQNILTNTPRLFK